jgi:cytochrome c556
MNRYKARFVGKSLILICLVCTSCYYANAADTMSPVHDGASQKNDAVKQVITDKKSKKMILIQKQPVPVAVEVESDASSETDLHIDDGLMLGTETDIVYRQNICQSLDMITQNILFILKNEAGDPADLVTLADALSAQASLMSSAYSKDTHIINATSNANNNIWKNLAHFQEQSDIFAENTAQFATMAAENQNLMLDDFNLVSSNCTSCHQHYKNQ